MAASPSSQATEDHSGTWGLQVDAAVRRLSSNVQNGGRCKRKLSSWSQSDLQMGTVPVAEFLPGRGSCSALQDARHHP